MKSAYLFIHTLLADRLAVGLFNKSGLIDEVSDQSAGGHSKIILNLLDKLLKKNKFKLDDLKGVTVVTGPGSFTGIRIGLVVANALVYLLKIPALGVRADEFETTKDLIKLAQKKLSKMKGRQFVLPFYGKEPNITVPRRI